VIVKRVSGQQHLLIYTYTQITNKPEKGDSTGLPKQMGEPELRSPPEPEKNKHKNVILSTLQALGFYSTLTASISSLVCYVGEPHNVLVAPRCPLYSLISF
jgi:hypothetical protein